MRNLSLTLLGAGVGASCGPAPADAVLESLSRQDEISFAASCAPLESDLQSEPDFQDSSGGDNIGEEIFLSASAAVPVGDEELSMVASVPTWGSADSKARGCMASGGRGGGFLAVAAGLAAAVARGRSSSTPSGTSGGSTTGASQAVRKASTPAGGNTERYKVIRELGSGGFGVVYLVESTDGLGRQFALKVAGRKKKDGSSATIDPDELAMMLVRQVEEARVMAAINDPRIVKLYALGSAKFTDGEHQALSMEYVDGSDIFHAMGGKRDTLEPVPTQAAMEIIAEVADCLYKTHHHVRSDGETLDTVHRDIKRANVMVTRSGQVKLMDFGAARAQTAGRDFETAQDMIIGTLAYLAPEYVRSGDTTHGQDIWALGLMMFEMLTGESCQRHMEWYAEQANVPQQKGCQRRFSPNMPNADWLLLIDYLAQRMGQILYQRYYADTQSHAKNGSSIWIDNLEKLFRGIMQLETVHRFDGKQVTDFLTTRVAGARFIGTLPGQNLREWAETFPRNSRVSTPDTSHITFRQLEAVNSGGVAAEALDLTAERALSPSAENLSRERSLFWQRHPLVVAGGALLALGTMAAGALGTGYLLAHDGPSTVSDVAVVPQEISDRQPAPALDAPHDLILEKSPSKDAPVAVVVAPIPAGASDASQPARPTPSDKVEAASSAMQQGKKDGMTAPAPVAVAPVGRTGTVSFTPAGEVKEVRIVSGGTKSGGSLSSPVLRASGESVTIEVTYAEGETRRFVVPAARISSEQTLRIGKNSQEFSGG